MSITLVLPTPGVGKIPLKGTIRDSVISYNQRTKGAIVLAPKNFRTILKARSNATAKVKISTIFDNSFIFLLYNKNVKSPNSAQYSPTNLILFGITGNLAVKKIIPALFHLHDKSLLPKLFNVIGFARRDLTNETLRDFIVETLAKNKDIKNLTKETLNSFLQRFTYYKGDFENLDAYAGLGEMIGLADTNWKTCSNRLFYLSVPPKYYNKMFQNLSDSGLTVPCNPNMQDSKEDTLGWTRVIVEKPFGANLATARELEDKLSSLFDESQIYRIDHYLGKEMLQNVLLFRFANNLLETSWNKSVIESIEIFVYEDIGIEGRANFYDGVGALRDMGQSHLLQMLALVTMDDPGELVDKNVRKSRAAILEHLKIYNDDEIKQNTSRMQYVGYKNLEKVKNDSTTETYFKVLAFLETERWRDVPIIIESGKKMGIKDKKIVVTFKDHGKQRNKVIFDLDGVDSGIYVDFWAKKIGIDFEIEKKTLSFALCKDSALCGVAEEYEKLLVDCFLGNQMLFVSSDEVSAMWKFIDPIVCAWQKDIVPLKVYDEGGIF